MSLQEELRDELGLEVPVLAGEDGELSVLIDGARVYSYQDLDRMPEPGEIRGLIEARRHQ